MINRKFITDCLGINNWSKQDQMVGNTAIDIAEQVFRGVLRDQGTPYIEHPVAVAQILYSELEIVSPSIMIVALLHDAIEVSPRLAPGLIVEGMGEHIFQMIWALTKEHKITKKDAGFKQQRAYHLKIAELPPDLLLIKLADRLHNLREINQSPYQKRIDQFYKSLNSFYLPLAKKYTNHSPRFKKMYQLIVKQLG